MHVDLLDVGTTKEVLDLDALAVVLGLSVNGEMSMNQSHLVDKDLKCIIIY